MLDFKQLQNKGLVIWKAIEKKFSDLRTDNKTVVLIICLLVSTLFWFLKALNDEYSTEVEFPIVFTNVPKNYALYGDTPDRLKATIEDAGFTIIRYKFSFVFSSLKFDVSKHFEQNLSSEVDGTIELRQAALINGIESELLSTTKIINIFPDNITISYSKLQEKRLPIKVLADISTEQQHIVNGPITTVPDSLLVIGNSRLLEETEAIYTHPVKANSLEDSLVKNVSLETVEGLKFDRKRVKLIIPVEAFTEKLLEVPVVGRGFPDSLDIRTFPGVVKVSCICGLSVYNKVHQHNFVCYINYEDVKLKNNGHTEVHVESNSEYAQRVMIRPTLVDYLIEKKD